MNRDEKFEKTVKKNTLEGVGKIQKAIEENSLVIFVGAGVSKNSGIPTWGEAIKELAKDLGIKAKSHYESGDVCHDYCDSDDYLKIPQYYFNERKGRKYLSKLKSIFKFDQNIQPNEIHDMIFDLNPVHIITTNFDDLLEKQLDKNETNTLKYLKVANDNELVSNPASNYIIKMHGEFDDIVLKESDYDTYSEKFKLIEIFVKLLFSTYTILFVGFSATDSNIRKILQWVNDLEKKTQSAYLIDINDYKYISKEELRIKYKYYQKQGIITLYKTQIAGEIENVFKSCKKTLSFKDNAKGMDLYRFLYFIKNYKSFDVNKCYDKLKQLEGLEVINNEVLEKVLNLKISERLMIYNASNMSFSENDQQKKDDIDTFRLKIVLLDPDNLKKNILFLKGNSRLESKERKTLNDIICGKDGTLLDKNDTKNLKDVIDRINKSEEIPEEEIEKIKYINDIIDRAQEYGQKSFIDNIIRHELKESCENNSNTAGIFERALKLYNQRKYVDSYEVLKEISNKNSQDPVIYYIAESNKKTVAETLKVEKEFSIYGMSEEEKRILAEYKKINTERIINQKIPESIQSVIRMFSMENIKKQSSKFTELSRKISNYKDLMKEGKNDFTNDYSQELLFEVYSFFNFMLGNYLFINNYWQQFQELWRQILKAIFESYTTIYSESTNKKFIVFEPWVCKIEDFDYFILYLIIEFTPNKDLEELLSKFKIEDLKLKNGEEDVNTLIIYFKNYIDEISDIRLDDKYNISNDKISNFLTIFRLINIDKEKDFNDIVSAYINFARFYVLYSIKNQDIYSGFLKFIRVVTNNFKDNISCKIYEDIIFQMYDAIREQSIYYYKDHSNLIIYCFEILKEKNYKLEQQKIIKIIDFYLKLEKANENKMECLDEILIEIYSYVDKIKVDINLDEIKKVEQGKYKTITKDNWEIIYLAVENGVIEFSKYYEKQLFDSIEESIQDKINEKSDMESSNEPLIKLMNCLFCFIAKNKIEDDESKSKVEQLLSDIQGVKEFFPINWKVLERLERLIGICLYPEGYDYSKVQIDDFEYLNSDIIEKIKSKPDNVKYIEELVLENSDFKENNSHLYEIFKDIFDNKDKDSI